MAEVQACPDVSHLQRLLDGLLPEQDQAELNAHLEQCATCQQRLDELIAGQGFWSDVARNLKSAHSEIEAGTATRYAARPGESPDQADDDLTLEFLEHSHKPDSLGRLGHYEVLEVIGRGGMGIVLRAFDEKLHRVVAIKVMAPRLAATSPPRKRFLREARAAAQVRHEHVVDIHAVEEQPIPHLVMEYVPGESLQQRLNRIGPLEVTDVLRIGQQIARGLAAAHAQGLIHRDVKPGNILLEKGVEERVKITDFGLARAADDASLTQSGMIAGTPLFMAPEQAQGGAIDHRADLFSLGSVLYTMCSGRPPFRASTSLAVLKRVVEDAPRPIQEIIPEVPQWLCDIITKLHAKRPEDRFQSAKEVADLLARCQKEYEQHGQVAPVAVTLHVASPADDDSPAKPSESPPLAPPKVHILRSESVPWRMWVIAATALLLLLCVLSLSEATGVTQFAATVIHLLTPQGTLVVETNDPDVNITIEGDGGLVITGAGLHEVRLKPGIYQLKADKNGQPLKLDQDLVTITRGDKQVVRVRLEIQPASAAVPKVETGAFVLLAGKGVAERKFDTLAEAVQSASDGDTIEVRGNGPFVTPPLMIGEIGLTIRAASSYRPILQCLYSDPKPFPEYQFFVTQGPLTLEGLEFHFARPDLNKRPQVLIGSGPTLHVANCKFRLPDHSAWNWDVGHTKVCVVRNCAFYNPFQRFPSSALSGHPVAGFRGVIDNCLMFGYITDFHFGSALRDASLRVSRTTHIGAGATRFHVEAWPNAASDPPARWCRLDMSSNILGPGWITETFQDKLALTDGKPLDGAQLEERLRSLVSWRGEQNLYTPDPGQDRKERFQFFNGADGVEEWRDGPSDLGAWRKFWDSPETGSILEPVRFQGGNLISRVNTSPEKLTPDDFRLRPDSAGYRAGKDGKDLGADVDLVGPGPAYERWKKTPQYQEWLKETGQVKE